MLRRTMAVASAAAATAFTVAVTAGAGATPAAVASSAGAATAGSERVCAAPASGTAACDAVLDLALSHRGQDAAAKPGKGKPISTTSSSSSSSTTSTTVAPSTGPSGYAPADLLEAYGLASAAAAVPTTVRTVAIVDAYDDPSAEADLAVYRSQFGLPPCTTGNGCLEKVDQTGGSSYPGANASWAEEISLDLDMVSAICPHCHILLVEAASAGFADLGAAEDYAAAHADVVSNSWGGSDTSDAVYGHYFDHPGVAITASSGDGGYGVEYPASSGYVTAVGGTSLTRSSSSRGWTETAWSGAGSGCSRYNPQPSWQAAAGTGCSARAVADVSADADPYTGVAVYDSIAYQGYVGWLVFGGTSVASPVVASVYALAGNASGVTYGSSPYSAPPGSLNDVTSGSNGHCGRTAQLCDAVPGWDGPTGLGTPEGTGAF